MDLGAPTTFDRAAMWYHDPSSVPLAWKLQASDDDSSWTDLAYGRPHHGPTLRAGEAPPGGRTTRDDPRSGRVRGRLLRPLRRGLAVEERLARALAAWRSAAAAPGGAPRLPPAEELASLRALGYVDSGGGSFFLRCTSAAAPTPSR